MTGYCLKCRESREIQNAQQVTMKNGREATRAPAVSAARQCSGSERRPDPSQSSGSSHSGRVLCWGATRPATTVPGLRLSDLANTLSLECSLREQVVTGSGLA